MLTQQFGAYPSCSIFITNDTALRMFEYISHVHMYCKIGNSQCLFQFKPVVRLVYTHYIKGASYTATLYGLH